MTAEPPVADISGEALWAQVREFAGSDVRGKIVLVEGIASPAVAHPRASWKIIRLSSVYEMERKFARLVASFGRPARAAE